MAKKTTFCQPDLDDCIPDEMESDLVKILESGPDNPCFKPDLEDNQKRWLIVGICLHSIITPALRTYTEPIVVRLYTTLQRTKRIRSQSYQKRIKGHGTPFVLFNYEAINNNSTLPKVRGKKDKQNYNYNVTNHVDFSKLFLVTYMTQYTGFDTTIDLSSLLGIMVNMDGFPQVIKNTTQQVRSDIRNAWAHCNLDEWDSPKYQSSFQQMFQMIKNLNLNLKEESELFGELTKWEINGFQFLQGYSLGTEIVKEIRHHTNMLIEFSLKMKTLTKENFTNVHSTLVKIQDEITVACESIEEIKIRQAQQEDSIHELNVEVDNIGRTITDIKSAQNCQETKVLATGNDLKVLSQRFDEIQIEQTSTEQRLSTLEETAGLTNEQLMSMQSNITELQNYTSHMRPPRKMFFYPPDRTECFVGRHKELLLLENRFITNANLQYTQVICGLGGCGKTTLSVEFAWRCQEMYPGGVFWMSAECSEALEDSIAMLATDINTTGNNSKETFRKTLKWLSDLVEKWLLVVDNADEENLSKHIIELLFGSMKRRSKGHIIITTRREQNEVENSMSIKSDDCICLYSLNYEDGVAFLRKRTGFESNEEDNENIEAIVTELGGLPLALEQAAAHIKSIKCTFGEYMTRFHKKRLKLLKALPSQIQMSKERLTVSTTWQLNIDYICEESEKEGLKTASKTVMDITSFLFADDIPSSLINIGYPKVEDKDLIEALEDQDSSTVLKQIIEILTRFSLFQSSQSRTLSVHRLVQEVIRGSMDNSRKSHILKQATRMLNFALSCADTPYTILHNGNDTKRGALYMWSKLAANANILKEHLVRFSKHEKSECDLCFNEETINILQTTAIFHSLHQRQDRALADQEQMSLIIPTLDLNVDKYRKVTAVTIPLQLKDRKRIKKCLASVIHDEKEECNQEECSILLDSDTLRLKGNEALKKGKYQDALQYYTEGLRACPVNSICCKILANRSQLYYRTKFYESALIDANRCIEISSNHHNAYIMKAYIVAKLIKRNLLPPAWKGTGLASASIAAYIQKDNLLRYKMKSSYPIINYILIDCRHDLSKEVTSGIMRPFTTFMLQKGRYDLKIILTPKSFQIIGIEDGVEIDTGYCFRICRPTKEELVVDIEIDHDIYVHFENVSFVAGGSQIVVKGNDVAVTFYKCKLSNGAKGCEAFPKCQGEKGCINSQKCKIDLENKSLCKMGNFITGQTGQPGIGVLKGGRAYLNSCDLDRCGGGGVLASDDGSLIQLKNCIVQNMRQMGIESKNGGTIKAEHNVIVGNQFHGVAIGPKGIAYLEGNTIQGNGEEGIWCGRLAKNENQDGLSVKVETELASKAIIIDNIISQNGLSGVSLDGGCVEVKSNKIFENWLWGMMIKLRSSCYAQHNDIFENKCGGIRLGGNFSASVILDGNTFRDHTGPSLHAVYEPIYPPVGYTRRYEDDSIFYDETSYYSRPVIKTSINIFRHNDKGVQHPKTLVDLIQTCCFCHEPTSRLKQCGKCMKATYCTKDCQTKHWKRHKHICKLLQNSYIVDIDMASTKPSFQQRGPGYYNNRVFHRNLKGIQEGPPPNKTSVKKFIVKIQSGKEYSYYDPNTEMILYDQSVSLDISFSNPVVYHLTNECGVLAENKFTTKTIFCWASFQDNGKKLRIYTDNLPPFQSW